MPEAFPPEVRDRICQHMNQDHGDALVLYAQTFGDAPATESARLVSIDRNGMDLAAQLGDCQVPLRITFDHPLEGAEDAHYTLIDMLQRARQQQEASG
ncbi:MAG: heme iron utilization protein [Cyanobacteria bacterium QS_8_64_29]|nr:MAG: heme iron utilization protein [Cyanobacteria bacterium QS_8_64_29]